MGGTLHCLADNDAGVRVVVILWTVFGALLKKGFLFDCIRSVLAYSDLVLLSCFGSGSVCVRFFLELFFCWQFSVEKMMEVGWCSFSLVADLLFCSVVWFCFQVFLGFTCVLVFFVI